MQDAVVDEIRKIRQDIEREFDDDPDKYLKHVYETQKRHGDRLVRREPKPRKARKAISIPSLPPTTFEHHSAAWR